MKKEELKEKAKGFWEMNKLAIGAWAIAEIGYLFGYKWAIHNMGVKKGDLIITNEYVKKMFLDAQYKYGGKKNNMTVFQYMFNEAVKPEDLGKLGEALIDTHEKCFPGTKPGSFTHFIAFGPTR